MSKSFNSFEQFAIHLQKLAMAETIAAQASLEEACVLIESEAKKEFGVYQDAAGPFNEWQELADSTKAQRVALGYTENDPLLRSGELRDSITHEVHDLEGAVGSTSDIMVYQELGTNTIPARPVLGPAAFRNHAKIKEIIGKGIMYGVLGENVIYTPGAVGAQTENDGL